MASPPTTTLTTIKEKIEEGEEVHHLFFRFSTGHKKNDLQKIHSEIIARGWQKVPDLENTYVWFGNKPHDIRDILKKGSYETHSCRVLTGILSSADLFEGTGTPPKREQENQQASANTAGNRKILEFFTPDGKKDERK